MMHCLCPLNVMLNHDPPLDLFVHHLHVHVSARLLILSVYESKMRVLNQPAYNSVMTYMYMYIRKCCNVIPKKRVFFVSLVRWLWHYSTDVS